MTPPAHDRTRVRRARSFRTRILLVVLAGAIAPLALLGFWLTRSAARSGEDLLRDRLSAVLDEMIVDIGTRWASRRSYLLSLTDQPEVQHALLLQDVPTSDVVPAVLEQLFRQQDAVLHGAIVRDATDRTRWRLVGTREDAQPLVVDLPIHDRVSGRSLGTIEASVRITSLLSERTSILTAGTVVGLFDARSGAALLPLPFDAGLITGSRFAWAGADWLTERRVLQDPGLVLVAAAPLAPFTQPFQRAARRGLWILLAVSVVSLALAAVFTGRMTRSLERLAAAAEAVSRGELDRHVEDHDDDEVGRVARSFNAMTANLRRTLQELSQRESLAAVGEFAANLAHEVRNPLTAIRVDLQMVEEQLPEGSPARALQAQALLDIDRLDRTVSGTLQVARSGRTALRRIDLREPLRAAARSAEPVFKERNAALRVLLGNGEPVHVEGDTTALEQLFLNLLLNAAQAVEPGGEASIAMRVANEDVVVTVQDNGYGIAEPVRKRMFEPFYSTRLDGTGLGLAIAKQIVAAHHGDIHIESAEGMGTTVRVTMRSSA